MKNIYLKKITIIGFFFISIVGTLSHFVYEWSQNNSIVGAFFAVNESTWEHLKIAIIPAFIWLVIILFITKNKNNFFIANLLSFLIIMITILIVFYGYKSILQRDVLIFDILLFYIAIGLGQFVSFKIMNYRELPQVLNSISIILLTLIFISFIVFTYVPPEMEIFRNPLNNGYGITSSK
ncbi:MAG: DUF6512 family protein [Clostridia bacterium]|nr:DUF6512 family protein [Clostridia bacterium]MDD4386564.1 DUF6512 family protein [Clostridia bacterium]